MTLRCLLLICLLVTGHFCLYAQERCATVEYHDNLKKLGQVPSDDAVFENWLKAKMSTLRAARANRKQDAPYKIPVVVHVIHNGEPVGTETNISDAQINSQISVLNEDFRRLNADANKTPSEFVPLAGSMDVEFILAKSDPEGLPTNGIVRVKGSKTGWVLADQYELKAQSYWPAEDYLNLWVCDEIDEYAGYGQYPQSNLPGIDNSSINRLTDGVVVWYQAFGSVDDGAFKLSSTFNKGRTLTHELGHFFGLRHIWGDDSGGCTEDDYVNDTPKQGSNSTGCPTHPRTSCGTVNMFQNYMDYTADACMNLFSKEQMTRMSFIIENSPRRSSLLTSPGLNLPVFVQHDLGIKNIVSPAEFECSASITPAIEVRNYGSNAITSAKIKIFLNGIETQTISPSLTLSSLETTTLNFSGLTAAVGTNELKIQIIEVNGGADGNAGNDSETIFFQVVDEIAIPFAENFNEFPAPWQIRNGDGKITWDIATAPRESPNNKAIRLELINYDDSYGEIDVLLSPTFDLSSVSVASLVFDVAFARYLASNDQLRVIVLKDCESIGDGTVIYQKTGSALATASPTSGSFVPAGPQDWRREFVNLGPFMGESNVQLAFEVVSDSGNNLYLDNISVLTTELEDVELQGVQSPSFITCEANPSPVVVFQNIGTKLISSLTLEYSINGVMNQITVDNLSVALGGEHSIQLPPVTLTAPTNTFVVTLLNPNGQPDQSPANNTGSFTLLFDQSADKIPFRQNFDNGLSGWRVFSPTGGKRWQLTNTNFNRSLYFNAFNNATINELSWLISPVLDFSAVSEASLVFDLSYRQRAGRSESLKLYGSKDCGETFEEISTVALPHDESIFAWVATKETDWVQDYTIVLDEFAGESNVRLAFAVVNDNGNNLFLDNVEFFTSNNPTLVAISERYNIYGYNLTSPAESNLQITFNLEERSEVDYTVVDVLGKVLGRDHLTDVLNQTYYLDEGRQLAAGTYVVNLIIGGQSYSNRIMITR